MVPKKQIPVAFGRTYGNDSKKNNSQNKGDNERAVSIITQIQHGQFVPVWPTEYAQAAAIYPKPNWS